MSGAIGGAYGGRVGALWTICGLWDGLEEVQAACVSCDEVWVVGELWVSMWWPWLPWGACGLHVGCMWRVCSGYKGCGMVMRAMVRCVVKCELWMSRGLHGAEGWLW